MTIEEALEDLLQPRVTHEEEASIDLSDVPVTPIVARPKVEKVEDPITVTDIVHGLPGVLRVMLGTSLFK